MKKLRASISNNKSIPICVGTGLLVSLLVSIILMIGLTSLIASGRIREENLIGVFLIRTVATLIGCLSAVRLANQKYMPVIAISAFLYLFVLIAIGVLFFDDSIHRLLSGVLSVSVGAVIALLVKLKAQTKRKMPLRFVD